MDNTDFKTLLDLVYDKKFAVLKATLSDMNEADIADFLCEADDRDENVLLLFRMLGKDISADVFARLPADIQQTIISGISDKEVGNIIEDLFVDDAVDMIEEMPAIIVKRVLKNARPETRELINRILKYPENSAGSIMTVEYIALKKNMTVEEAIDYIRRNAVDKETIYDCFVTDSTRVLQGVVSFRSIILSGSRTLIGDIMEKNIISATTTDDREDVVDAFSKYDLISMPVVDKENRLVGIITVDDAVDVMEEEATEDFEKMAGMLPSEKPYLSTGVFKLASNRIPWLLFLMVSSMLTGGILAKYENAIAVLPVLVTFIPMLTDTGGNAGSQSSTMIIRGMAVGDIEITDIFKVLWKELRVAIICGVALAAVNCLRLALFNTGDFSVIMTITFSLIATVITAKTIGGLLPIAANALKLDPAIMAAPLITTIVDAVSLIIYFTLASHLLGI